jgi:hypothetical protein
MVHHDRKASGAQPGSGLLKRVSFSTKWLFLADFVYTFLGRQNLQLREGVIIANLVNLWDGFGNPVCIKTP